MGIFFHAQEDTYAHSSGKGNRNWDYYGNLGVLPNGLPFGHACYGHDPDHTWLDSAKGMMMAKRVYTDMKNLVENGGTFADPDDVVEDANPTDLTWQGIASEVKDFMDFDPSQVPGDTFKTGFNWTTVTRQGYLDKIHKLKSILGGYTIGQEPDDIYLKKTSVGKKLAPPNMHHGAEDLMNLSSLPLTGL